MDYFAKSKNKYTSLLVFKRRKKNKLLFCLSLPEVAKGVVSWGNRLLICFNEGFITKPELLTKICASLVSLCLIII